MTPHRARFVTACQQLLALAVVLAVLTPAARVVSLDVVGTGPSGGSTVARPTAGLAAYVAQAVRPSRVDTAPVKSKVREVQLTSATAGSGRALPTTGAARVAATRSDLTRLTTKPQAVTGFGEVGVTWASGSTKIPETGIAFRARTRTHGAWTSWATIPYDPDHGPDPHSAEGRHARPGTDPMLVGRVGHVQVRAVTSKPLPADMRLAVIAPGHASRTATERAAYDTSTMDGNAGQDSVYRAGAAQPVTGEGDPGDTASLAAAVFTPQPVIYSRAQWGADESIRGKSSLHYSEVHAGFVHHTVNANDYSRAEVPALLRSIYAYHVKSRGWSDIGYNYLIDRFGRIWEGRYGGVDRPVVGAHTLNYNDDSFGASAIGNYEITEPSQAMVQAYATLFAWKLSLHGVAASSTHQWVTSRWFEGINGHRDADSTLCPGKYLYAKIPEIRSLAAAAQQGWAGRDRESDLASTPHPDLVVRRASDGEGLVIPTGGLVHFRKPTPLASGLSGASGVVVSPDLTGDGVDDLLVRQADGGVGLRAGIAAGGFEPVSRVLARLHGKDQIVSPGDLNSDGRNDLVARDPATGRLLVYLGQAGGSFSRKALGAFWGSFDLIAGAGDVTGDGHPDLVARDAAGKLWLYAGNGGNGFAHGVQVPGDFSSYDAITGGGDYTADGVSDLFLHGQDGKGYVLPAHGDGTYGRALGPLGRLSRAAGASGGNVTGSAAPDLVAVSGDNLLVWANPGTFDLGKPIDTGADFSSSDRLLNAGDWDRDGSGDVITRDKATGNLFAWPGDGQGHLGSPTQIGTGFGSVRKLAAVGDMTGDGYPDLMGQPKGGDMRIYPGRGMTGLGTGYPAYGAIAGGAQIGVGRWNADGAPDTLVRKGSALTVYQGNGPGGLYGPSALAVDLSPYDWVIGVSDLELIGHPDLLVRQRGTGLLLELPGTDAGFRAPVYLGDGLAGYDLAD